MCQGKAQGDFCVSHLTNVLCSTFSLCFPTKQRSKKKYYLSNVLKKSQRVGIHQFIQRVEQLNAYIAQLPCWYYSPSYNAGMTLVVVPFSEADLGSQVLRMCPHQWQDQYNLQEKGMTPMDMHSLQASLKAIERVCTHEKAHAPSGKKASHKHEAGAKRPSNGATKQAHKKVRFEKSCKLCKKIGGAHTTHATKYCHKYEKDRTVKTEFCAAKKAGKKPNPAKQLFAQLSEKLDKLEKTLKKASHKSKKRRREDSNSDSEWEIGSGSTRKLGLNLEKAIKRSKFTPPSLIKATPSELTSNSNIVSNQQIASNQDIACPATLSNPAILCKSARLSNPVTLSEPAILRDSTIISNPATHSNPAISCDSATLRDPAMPSDPVTFGNPSTLSDADDVMLTSPIQREELHCNHSTPTNSNPSEGSTTAVVAVMRGNPKDGYTRQRSSKHCKQKIVRVLLDSGSNGNLFFVNKEKPMLLPYSKRLVPQSWNTSNGIFQTRRKAPVELNFFEYSDSKRYHVEPDVVKYYKNNRP